MPAIEARLQALLTPGSWLDSVGVAEPEITLPGGDVTQGVVRIGQTVGRPRQAQSAAVAAYLSHLELAGFDGAPRFLGTDARGRDVLQHLPGVTASQPPEDWVADDGLMAPLGALVGRLHTASAGFQPPTGLPFFRDTMPDPPELAGLLDPPTIVGHNDVTPQNVIIRAGVPVGLVDFDLAGPTTPAREVANAALHWAPICDPADRPSAFVDSDCLHRTRLIADGYQLGAEDRGVLADVLLRSARVGWHRMRNLASELGGGWARMWDEGVGEVIRGRELWLIANGEELTRCLLEPAA